MSVLTGKELRHAAKNGLKVRYIFKDNGPLGLHKNQITVMERMIDICSFNCDSGDYFIGDGDINVNRFKDDELVSKQYPGGYMEVRKP